MNKKTLKIILAVAAAVILIIAATILFFGISGNPTDLPASAPVTGQSDIKEVPEEETYNFSEAEIRELIDGIAKERFGDDAFVIFLSTEGPSQVVIDGIKRNVYIYAADSASAHKESGEVRGLYHVDADTGEIFDNGSGTMEKIIIGE